MVSRMAMSMSSNYCRWVLQPAFGAPAPCYGINMAYTYLRTVPLSIGLAIHYVQVGPVSPLVAVVTHRMGRRRLRLSLQGKNNSEISALKFFMRPNKSEGGLNSSMREVLPSYLPTRFKLYHPL